MCFKFKNYFIGRVSDKNSREGQSCLHFAAKYCDLKMFEYLLTESLTNRQANDKKPFNSVNDFDSHKIFERKIMAINEKDYQGRTCLYLAAVYSK